MNNILLFLTLSLFIASAVSLDSSSRSLLLNLHNKERAYVGIADLKWDSGLESTAQAWAEFLAENNKFYHSGQPVGENLASASNRTNVVSYMFCLWSGEKRSFSNAKPYPNVSTDGGMVGHYTQIIWGRTYAVGCGVAYKSGVNYLVCQYKLSGNYIGNYVYYPGDVIRTPTGSSRLLASAPKKKGNTRGANRKGRK